LTRQTRQLRVDSLARVEGEGALRVIVEDGAVQSAELQIYEPPRFFEAFLRGRQHTEPPDITSRICGICPVAYQTTSCQAIEAACQAEITEDIASLRRLLYCGEWISSHALHMYLLHIPDFLGYPDVIELARDHRAAVERGLRLKQAGNAILELVGGRAIHPVNPCVGGFHRATTSASLAELNRQLRQALDDALATVEFVATFDFPDRELDATLLAVHHADLYAIDSGEIRSSDGHSFPASEFANHIVEFQVPHSTALHAALNGRSYLTGPLARYTLNFGQLSPLAREAAIAGGLGPTCRNPFRSIVIRAVETVYAIEEALRLIAEYRRPDPPAIPVAPRSGTGYGVTEAPRGLLYHHYQLDADGMIRAASIVPPTSQNLPVIEADLREVISANMRMDDAALTAQCERTIRNYDPCISCSAHFLDFTVVRR
jgi:coenzyme F420-reducing hydrogenase alpha subunit